MFAVKNGAVHVWNAINNTTTACLATALGCGLWVYDKMITEPLRIFYFVGPVWGAIPKEDICAQITRVPASRWLSSPEMMKDCEELTEHRFHSWDAGLMTSVYFFVLTFVVLQFTCNCCFLRPLLRELRARN
jgi:hypothetical protein